MRKYVMGLVMAVMMSGCYCSWNKPEPEIVVKTDYVQCNQYKFDKIDLSDAYIDAGSKEVQKVCTPLVNEAMDVYAGVKEYYEWQMDESGKIDDNRTEK